MKNKCNIIRDILPLYVENIISDDTKAFVEAHLAKCPECKKEQEDMRMPSELPTDVDAVPLKKIRTKLFKKRVQTVVLTMAIVVALLVTTFSFLTSPKYLPYTEDILSLTKLEDGTLIISFDDNVTGYNVDGSLSEDGATYTYHISAWNTTWDKYFTKRGTQNFVLKPNSSNKFTVYYTEYNSTESIYVYGVAPCHGFGVMMLPRLVLGYYLMLAIVLVIISLVMILIFRKKVVVRAWIQRLMLFPLSYILGHICVRGLTTSTYSAARDFSLILLISILIFVASMLALSLYKAKKHSHDE